MRVLHVLNADADVAMEEVDVSTVVADDKTAVPGCFDTSPDHYGKHGLGLYVRDVDLEADGRYRIRFDGLGLYARVYWDGAQVAECRLPYSTFEVDVAAAHGTHRLAVLVGNCYWEQEWSPLYRTGDDYYAFGGIYRSVTLERLPDGLFLERVQVFTADLAKRSVRLRFLFGGDVADGPAEVALAFDKGEESKLTLDVRDGAAEALLTVPGGQVWSPASPHLHTLTAACRSDAVVERFGLRMIATSGESILLNGEKIYLQGFNRHESHPEFGPVQTDQLMLDDLKWLRDIGANYIRAVHYQQDPPFSRTVRRTRLPRLGGEHRLGRRRRTPRRALVHAARRRAEPPHDPQRDQQPLRDLLVLPQRGRQRRARRGSALRNGRR